MGMMTYLASYPWDLPFENSYIPTVTAASDVPQYVVLNPSLHDTYECRESQGTDGQCGGRDVEAECVDNGCRWRPVIENLECDGAKHGCCGSQSSALLRLARG